MATMAMRPTPAPLTVITGRAISTTASSWGLDLGTTGVIVTAGEVTALTAPEAVTITAAVDIPAEEVPPTRADVLRFTGPDRGIEMVGPLAITATARPRIAVVVPRITTTATARPRTEVGAVSATNQERQ